MTEEDDVIELPEVDTDPELGDHPEEVTEEEAARGHAAYLAVDDLDDEDDGMTF